VNTFVLRNTQATLSVVFSAGNADGTVTATITRADGSTLSTGNATHDTSGGAPAGRYTYVLPPQAQVASLTITWAGTFGGIAQSLTFPVEVVGAHLFTVAEARAFGDRALANSTVYPDDLIIDARERITDWFAVICSVSFTPRFRRVLLDGSGTCTMWLPNTKVSRVFTLTQDGLALDIATANALDLSADVYVYPTGRLERRSAWRYDFQNVIAEYEHGHAAPPDDISRAGMMLARYDLTTNQLADRFLSFQNDLGVIRQSVPGWKFPTGIPIVDSVLARYSHCAPLQPLTT
jgi:hypothetical protein